MALKDRLATQWKNTTTVPAVDDAIEAEIQVLETQIDTAIDEKSIDAGDEGLAEILALLRPHLPGVLDAAIDTIADTEATRLLLYALAAANRSFGSADDIVRVFEAAFPAGTPTFPESAAQWLSSFGPNLSLQTTDYAEITIQTQHSPAPLDDVNFRTEFNKILCRAAGPTIDCVVVTTDLGGWVPDHLYTAQESGPPTDQIGTEDFVEDDQPASYQQTPGEEGRFYLQVGDIDQPLNAPIPVIGVGEQQSFWIRLRIHAGAGTDYFMRGHNAANDWELRVNSSGHLILQINDDVGLKTATVAEDHDNVWVNVVCVIDATTSATQKIWTSLGSATVDLGAVTTSLGTTAEFVIKPNDGDVQVDVGELAIWERALTDGEALRLIAKEPTP